MFNLNPPLASLLLGRLYWVFFYMFTCVYHVCMCVWYWLSAGVMVKPEGGGGGVTLILNFPPPRYKTERMKGEFSQSQVCVVLACVRLGARV